MSDVIRTHTLTNGSVSVTLLSLGCAVQDWQVGGRRVVLGYADPEDYRTNPMSLGVVVGRVANRISNACFSLNGQDWPLPANNGHHHIHGGPGGVSRRNWQMQPEGPDAVVFQLASPHGDGGYPGAVQITIRISLEGHALRWDMTAVPDRETPVNLAQHLYFNLGGTGSVRDHQVQIAAGHCTPTNSRLVPTGQKLCVDGTRYDFRSPRSLAKADPSEEGYDLNFALEPHAEPKAQVLAHGLHLRLWTDRPGLQLYTANTLRAHGTPLNGQRHGPFSGLCLEAQDFPNALNTPGFGNILCSPEAPYRQSTVIEIAPAA